MISGHDSRRVPLLLLCLSIMSTLNKDRKGSLPFTLGFYLDYFTSLFIHLIHSKLFTDHHLGIRNYVLGHVHTENRSRKDG